jgi:hypothetical protein
MRSGSMDRTPYIKTLVSACWMMAASAEQVGLRRTGVGRIGRVEGGPLFERELSDKFHDAFFDDIGFNANPWALRIKANA